MMRNRKLLLVFFIAILLCSNRCTKEGTSFHLYNHSKYNITLLSKEEIEDYKNDYIGKEIINQRTVKKRKDIYIGFEEYELERFKNNNESYIFYILELKYGVSNDFLIRDSIIIKSKNIGFNNIENCILYDDKSVSFFNRN
jgi:hypothetical protein